MSNKEFLNGIKVMCGDYDRWMVVYGKTQPVIKYVKTVKEAIDLEDKLRSLGYDVKVHGVNADGSTTVAWF